MSHPKHVLVLGATGAIGKEVARALRTRGVRVTAHGRNPEKLNELARELSVETIQSALDLDVGRDLLLKKLANDPHPFDGLVSCSGAVCYENVGDVSESALSAQFNINFLAPFLVSQALCKRLIQHRLPGSVLHIASSVAIKPVPSTTGYAASKAALLASVRAMALELGPHQVRVNALLPGLLDTEMTRVVRSRTGEPVLVGEALDERLKEQFEQGRRAHPLGRLGTPEEVACTAVHVLGSAWMTGSAVSLDGGASL